MEAMNANARLLRDMWRAVEVPQGLGKFWHGFLRWRKRGWPARVLILLIIGAILIGDRFMLIEMVRIACRSLFVASEPSVMHATMRFYRAEEAARLRFLLLTRLDGDGDGRLDPTEAQTAAAAGLRPKDLNAPCHRLDLAQLNRAARELRLVPWRHTLRKILWETLHTAQAETEQMFGPDRKRVFAILRPSWDPSALRRPAVWRWELRKLMAGVAFPFARSGPILYAAAGYLMILAFSYAAAGAARPYGRLTGIVAAVVLNMLPWLPRGPAMSFSADPWWERACLVSQVLIGIAIGIFAGRLARAERRRADGLFRALFWVGVTVIGAAWLPHLLPDSLSAWLNWPARVPEPVLPFWEHLPGCTASGLLLCFVGARGLLWSQRRGKPRESSEPAGAPESADAPEPAGPPGPPSAPGGAD
jgi:hypothetical protein